jgi:hypothetical protein
VRSEQGRLTAALADKERELASVTDTLQVRVGGVLDGWDGWMDGWNGWVGGYIFWGGGWPGSLISDSCSLTHTCTCLRAYGAAQ